MQRLLKIFENWRDVVSFGWWALSYLIPPSLGTYLSGLLDGLTYSEMMTWAFGIFACWTVAFYYLWKLLDKALEIFGNRATRKRVFNLLKKYDRASYKYLPIQRFAEIVAGTTDDKLEINPILREIKADANSDEYKDILKATKPDETGEYSMYSEAHIDNFVEYLRARIRDGTF